MPRDEFLCEKRPKPFELTMTFSERERAKPKWPTCKGTKVVRSSAASWRRRRRRVEWNPSSIELKQVTVRGR
jgi:hypothetical protein